MVNPVDKFDRPVRFISYPHLNVCPIFPGPPQVVDADYRVVGIVGARHARPTAPTNRL